MKKRKSPKPPAPPKPRPKRKMRVKAGMRGKTGKAVKKVKKVKKGTSDVIKNRKGKPKAVVRGKAVTKKGKKPARPGKPVRKVGRAKAVRPRPIRSGRGGTKGTGKAAKPGRVKPAKKPAKPVERAKPAKPVKPAKPRARKGSRSIGVVSGFRGIAEEYAAQVVKEFKELLDRGKALIGGFVYVFHLRNNTVDAEWRVPVGRGIDPIDLALQMEEALRGFMLRQGSWVSSGLRFPPSRITPTNYDKWRSLYTVQAYAQRGNKRASNFATLRDIIEGMGEKKRRKAEWLFVKLHWNVDDIKPTRDEI